MENWFPKAWEALVTFGAAALAVSLLAGWADHRRLRRRHADAVGCMPWTIIYIGAFLIACVLLGLAAREWFAD